MGKFLSFLGLAALAFVASGHSWLSNPEADFLNKGQPECRIGKPDDVGFENLEALNCPGPCGEVGVRQDRDGGEFFSLTKGMTKLARGEKLFMKWTRNNHFGGFVRFTLVPKSKRMQKHIHEMFAFHFSCWEAGEIWCGEGDDCGTDEMGLRYQTEVQIPKVFPNGEYILGWTWFGGTRFRDGSEKSEYGDYYSCANVVIDGTSDENGVWTNDDAVVPEHEPQYIPGMNDKSIKKCLSSVSHMGDCVEEPCKRDGVRFAASEKIPHCFNQDSLKWESSYRIRSEDVRAAAKGELAYTDPCNGEQPPIAKGNQSESNKDEDDPEPEEANGTDLSGMDSEDDPEPEDKETEAADGSEPEEGNESSDKPKLLAIKLLDSISGEIKDYSFNSAINVADYKEHMTVRVDVSHPKLVKAVKFLVNGKKVHTEYDEPYYVGGNDEAFILPWTDGKPEGESLNPPLGDQFTLRIEVEGKSGEMFDDWTVYPQFEI